MGTRFVQRHDPRRLKCQASPAHPSLAWALFPPPWCLLSHSPQKLSLGRPHSDRWASPTW